MSGKTVIPFAIALLLLLGCATAPQFPTGCEPPEKPGPALEQSACLYPLAASMPAAIEERILRLAVIPPGKDETRGLSPHLREEMIALTETQLGAIKDYLPRLEIVERSRIDVAIRELGFQAGGHIRDDNFLGVGRMLGADHLFLYDMDARMETDIVSLQLYGGFIHARASGKLIRVETGTVVFHQTSMQDVFFRPPAENTRWNVGQEQALRGALYQASLGLMVQLQMAVAPFPTGIIWGVKRGSTRVEVLNVLGKRKSSISRWPKIKY